jgi:REP element-mobilizing transposase RayT
MRLHRNSQKRHYVPDGIYFITTNTYDRYPYFQNDILCELFLETLNFTALIKGFNLHGFAINPEHLHLLIEPTGKYNYSEIMGTLKRNFARDCNDLISGRNFQRSGQNGYDESAHSCNATTRKFVDIRSNPYFEDHLERLSEFQSKFFTAYGHRRMISFQWQSSFRDHLIRDENDYINHLKYIKNQPLKHHLPERKWYWIVGEAE